MQAQNRMVGEIETELTKQTSTILGEEEKHTQVDEGIFTRHTDPFKKERIEAVLSAVTFGPLLTEEQLTKAKELIQAYADCFALAISEVKAVPNAVHQLNIPPNTTFSKKIHQRPLTTPQRQFLNKKIDEMLKADIIKQVDPSEVKCVSPTTLAQKAHEGGGMTLDELQYHINMECKAVGIEGHFNIPDEPPQPKTMEGETMEQKWRICQNFAEVNKVTEIAPMPQGDIRMKQQ